MPSERESCPDDDRLGAFVAGRLSPSEAAPIERHLDGCRDCAELIAALRTAVPEAEPSPMVVGVGDRFDRYELVELLGAGAMGAVWLALDLELDRRVALKLLEPRLARQQALWLREAQAMARLDHPHVVGIYDVGVARDRPYLAMEYIEGCSLRQWLRAERRSFAELLDVFIQAGRGLAAAHEAGLVHRDFKPDNVLVDTRGRVKVGDFGLARAGRDPSDEGAIASGDTSWLSSELTAAGAVIGTPAYMAPEQFEGRHGDPRIDQFAFGVALYEAVYGERPFRARSFAELAEQVRAGRAPGFDERAGVPAWMRSLLARGLAHAPDDRFASMDELLAALERGRDRPRRVRRALAGASLLVGLGLGAWMLIPGDPCAGVDTIGPTWTHERAERVAAALRATKLPYAERVWARLEGQLDDRALAWSAMRREVCEATRVRGEQSTKVLDLRMVCLERRRRELERLVATFEHADARVVDQADRLVRALPPVSVCGDLEAVVATVPDPGDPRLRASVDELRDELGAAELRLAAGAYDEALSAIEGARERAAALGYPPLDAEVALLAGTTLARLGRYEDASATLRDATTIALEVGDRRTFARASATLAQVLGVWRGLPDEGRYMVGLGLAASREVGEPEPLEAELHLRRGEVLRAAGHYDEALADQRRALELLEAEGDRLAIAEVHFELGATLTSAGSLHEAERELERAIAVFEAELGGEHPELAELLSRLATVYIVQDRPREGIGLLERALALREAALGHEHPLVANTLNNLGLAEQAIEDYDAALERHREALRIRRALLGERSPFVIASLNNIGYALLEAGRLDEAAPVLEEALSLGRELRGEDHPEVLATALNLGRVALGRGALDDAIAYFERVVELRQRVLGVDNAYVGSAQRWLARAYLAAGALPQARAAAEAAAARSTVTHGLDNFAESERLLADLSLAEGQEAEAATRIAAAQRTVESADVPAEIRERALASLASASD